MRPPKFLKLLLSLFLPTSLLAFTLILIAACNGFLCLEASTPSSTPPLMAAKPEPHHPPKPKKPSLRRLLRPTSQSKTFESRTKSFFNSSCELRFFMTWISSSETFSSRELMAVQTLFKTHPESCLLILSSAMDGPSGETLLNPLKSRGYRVAAVSPDFGYLLRDTPAAAWLNRLRRGRVSAGEVPLGQNLSNLLRHAVLYKFGGVYLDADVLVLKRFLSLKNTIGAQAVDLTGNWSRINNAVMIFDKGHPLLFKFMEEFSLTFDGSKWGHNGPYLVSRVSARVKDRPGFEFTVLPPPAFYPVDWSRIGGLFRAPRTAEERQRSEGKLAAIRRGSFAVHLWNRHSRGLAIERGSVIDGLMADYCVLCNSSSLVSG